MKKLFWISSTFILAAFFVFSSCTKEGPQGPAGPAGADGTDGTDGVDGNAVCLQCHTLAVKDAITAQYEESGHAAGGAVSYAGGRLGCAKCHSHEGFVETQHTGMDTTAADIPIPTRIACATCHDFHETLDFEGDGEDYALRTKEPVTLLMDDTYTIDFEGSSNLCAVCHQPRRAGPEDDGSGEFNITSTHWGPHHGPHATLLEGIGGYELGVGYPAPQSSTHRTGSSCTDCHMHSESGHTWHVEIASCTGCHEGATDFNINNVQTDVADLMAQLKQKFIDNGMWNTDDDEIIPGVYPIDHAGAFYNYATVADDRSMGVHNPEYIKTLLINSIGTFN